MVYYGAFAENLTNDMNKSRSSKIRKLAGERIRSVQVDKGHVIPRCRQLTKAQCLATSRGIYEPCKVVKITESGKDGEWFCDYKRSNTPKSIREFEKIRADIKDRRGLSMDKVYRKWGTTDNILSKMVVRALTKVAKTKTAKMLRRISEARIETISHRNIGSSKRSAMNRAMQCDLLTPSHSPVESGMREYADSCRRSLYCELVSKEDGVAPEGLSNIVLKRKSLGELKELRCSPSKNLGPMRQYSRKMLSQKFGGSLPYIQLPYGHRRNRDGRLVMYQLKPQFRVFSEAIALKKEEKLRENQKKRGLVNRVAQISSTVSGNMLKSRMPLGYMQNLEDDDVLRPCEHFTYAQCPAFPGGPRTKFVTGRYGTNVKNPYTGIQHCVRTWTGCKEPTGDDRNPFARYRDSLSNPEREYKSLTKGLHNNLIRDKRLPMARIRALEKAFEARTGQAMPYKMGTYKEARAVYDAVRRNTIPDELRDMGLDERAAKLIEASLRPILATRLTLDI